MHPYSQCKACGRYHDEFDTSHCEWSYNPENDTYDDGQNMYSYSGATEIARQKRIQRSLLEVKLRQEKQARVDAGEMKVCSECDKERPHDPNDYICIACRDGEDALPFPAYDVAA
jgi:hypothetical protein